MKASIVYDAPTDRHLVYLWSSEDGTGARVARYRDSGGTPMITRVPPGGELPVWAVWDTSERDAISAALRDDDDDALLTRIDDGLLAEISGGAVDARLVRDRLLTLVEGMVANGRP